MGSHHEETVFLLKLAKRRLAEFLNQPYLEGIQVTSIVMDFKAFSQVNEIVEKLKADWVVMGLQGEDIFVGPKAERVVRASDIPVLVIKDDMDDFKVHHFIM